MSAFTGLREAGSSLCRKPGGGARGGCRQQGCSSPLLRLARGQTSGRGVGCPGGRWNASSVHVCSGLMSPRSEFLGYGNMDVTLCLHQMLSHSLWMVVRL